MKSLRSSYNAALYTPLLNSALYSAARAARAAKDKDRPHDGLHAKMSCLAYANAALLAERMNATGSDTPLTEGLTEEEQGYADELKKRGWKVAEHYPRDKVSDNGYAGIAFEHAAYRQLVIAHRGTRPTLEGVMDDVPTDLELLQRQLVEHHASAMSFSLSLYEQYAAPEKQWKRVGLVGHSLGGFLAQVSLYGIARFRDLKKGPHVYAVTLDNPGAAEFLESLEPSILGSKKVGLETLDITAYLSEAVNLINASAHHVGTVYAIHDPHFQTLNSSPIDYLSNSHAKARLTNCFNLETGEAREEEGYAFIRMESWPTITYFPSSHLTSGFGLVAKGVLNSSTLYKKASSAVSSAVRAVVDFIPGAKSIAMQAGFLYHLGKELKNLGTTAIDDSNYQAFCENQAAMQLLGSELQKEADESRLSDTATVIKEETATRRLMQTLKSQLEQASDFNRSTDLSLRHFSSKASIFLKQFHKEVTSQHFRRHFATQLNAPWLMSYTIDTEYVSTTDSGNDARLFRAKVEETITAWPAEYFKEYYFLMDVVSVKSSDLSEIKEKLGECQHHHWEVLKTLRALQTQSRLYLFGMAPQQEIEEHQERDNHLQLLRYKLGSQYEILEQLSGYQSEEQITRVAQLKEQFNYQDKLLLLAKTLNLALLNLKQKQPEKIIKQVDMALEEINQATFQQQLKADKLQSVSLEELYACCYNLTGKARRQQVINMKDGTQTAGVIDAYETALTHVPDDYPTLSSLAAFYDDLEDYQKAEIYHEKALSAIDEGSHAIDKERRAVTYSNYAQHLYNRAQLTQDNEGKAKLLEKAQKRLEYSLDIKPNAGTHHDLAKVEQALADMKTDQEEAQTLTTSALRHLDNGLLLEPGNTKLLVERAQTHYQQGQDDKAIEDAERAQILLEDRRNLSEHKDYYAKAEQVIEDVKKKKKKKGKAL